jgi:hypothetical protein
MTINVHYDGRAIIPDEPIDLPVGRQFKITIIEQNEEASVKSDADVPRTKGQFSDLARHVADVTEADGIPTDLSYQHDHYLYGTPKR